jgi:ABC-2 type transport system permease protein
VSKVFAVIRREFVERVRTRTFLVSTLLLPLLMAFGMVVPALLMRGGERTIELAIVDGTDDALGARIELGLQGIMLDRKDEKAPRYRITRVPAVGNVEAARDSLLALTGFARKERPESFDGVLVVTPTTLAEGKAEYFGANVGAIETMSQLRGTISQVLIATRLEQRGVDPSILATAMARADLVTTKVSDGKATGQSGEASFFLAYVMGFILYLGIILYGSQTATSVIEEKTSRIMEVLASSLTPFQMLLGKVLGVGFTGLLQLGIWAGTLYLVSSQRTFLAGVFGLDPAAMQALPIPSMPGDLLVVFLGYFLLGFLLYGALFAAIGSMVNSMQEAQQSMTPVTILIMIGFFGVFSVINDANSTVAITMSYIPFFAPFVMPVRWSMSSVPVLQLALSLALMVGGLLAVTWLAGRIYRTGILMYGKKPSLAEVWRWIRA